MRAGYDNTHSRVVAWLKIVLPLAALVMLSTIFLLARTVDPAQTLPYADVAGLAREQRIGNPNYAGVTSDGAAVAFAAEAARPDPREPEVFYGVAMRATIEAPDGMALSVSAPEGSVDGRTETAELGGGVTVETADGYSIETARLAARLDATRLQSEGEVRASGRGRPQHPPAGAMGWARAAPAAGPAPCRPGGWRSGTMRNGAAMSSFSKKG